MTAEPVTATPSTPVGSARILMDQYGIDLLPVVDGSTVLGTVASEQLERALVPSLGLGF
jgi:CBS domain-containing protein